jgi:hypothetical protein
MDTEGRVTRLMKHAACTAMLASAYLLLGVASATAQSAKALTNEDVLVLVKVGLADEVIIAKIQQAPEEALDVSTDTVLNLSKAGVGQGVIQAMVERVAPPCQH